LAWSAMAGFLFGVEERGLFGVEERGLSEVDAQRATLVRMRGRIADG